MGLTVIKAKIAAGILPQTNGGAERTARYVAGVCVGCDGMIRANEISIELCGPGPRPLLHADCYVMWTEVCAEGIIASPLCNLCGKTIKRGTPRYRLGGVAIVHVACRDKIKPQWPRSGPQEAGRPDAA